MTDIICFPDAMWDAPLWTNRQHMMRRLARNGAFRVLYVNPPSLGMIRDLVQKRDNDTRRLGANLLTLAEHNLWLLNIPLPLPNRVLRNRTPQIYDHLVRAGTQAAASALGFTRPIVWTYSPFVANYLDKLDAAFVIYDCVDRYPQLPFYAARGETVVALDHAMTQKADAVLCTSSLIYEEKKAINPRSYLVGNAADVDLFAQARTGNLPRPAELAGITQPIIGFHGALDNHRIDYALLTAIARARPDWSLVFIGPRWSTPELEALAQQPNVTLVGPKAPGELPAYVAQYAVSILPYRLTEYVKALSPLKIYEYLAAGKPIVSVPVPHVTQFEVVRLASTPEQFVEQIEAALRDTDATTIARRVEVAALHSWDAKVQRVLELIPELTAPDTLVTPPMI
jgi:glycosyltransferase involved in cell wall biosynthesis